MYSVKNLFQVSILHIILIILIIHARRKAEKL